jgi:DNA-binding NarL/FixJ family response regulator
MAGESNKLEGPIRVLLADDHTMFRQGIRQMLETDPTIEVVAEVNNGVEAIALAGQVEPDVILLDLEMPVMGGEEAIEQLLKVSSSPRIVILSMHTSQRLLRMFLARGASGYVSKSASIEDLVAVVHNAVQCPRSPKGDNAMVVVPHDVFESVEEGETDLTPGNSRSCCLQPGASRTARLPTPLPSLRPPSSAIWPTSTPKWA